MDAFVGLEGHNGMIRWLADYKQVETSIHTPPSSQIRTTKTYNILLEYGAMDLGDYFREKLPPILPGEIEAFWRSLFAVAFALKGIHNLKVNNGLDTKEYFG